MESLLEADRCRIRERIETYCYSLDARDFALTEACFTPEAQIVHRSGAQVFAGPRELSASLVGFLTKYRSTIHALSNIHVEDDRGVVRVRYSALVTLAPLDGASVIVRGVRYDDEMVRSGDDWVISRRFHDPLWQYVATTEQLT
jgi:head-tail adaptor